MKRYFFFLIILVCFVSCAGPTTALRTPAQQRPLDVVFDLDWTLIGQVKDVKNISPEEIVVFGDEYYRVMPGARELIAKLLEHPQIRLSFFSGGGRDRNLSVLEQIKLGTSRASLLDHAYKVLSRDDLTDLSDTAPDGARFSERYKKDLTKINSNLSQVIMIDDNALFAVTKSQRANFLWLGETLENLESYSVTAALEIPPKYRPTSYTQWLSSRLKLTVVSLILDELIADSATAWDFDRLQQLAKDSELEGGKWSKWKTQALKDMNILAPKSCFEHFEFLLLAAPNLR